MGLSTTTTITTRNLTTETTRSLHMETSLTPIPTCTTIHTTATRTVISTLTIRTPTTTLEQLVTMGLWCRLLELEPTRLGRLQQSEKKQNRIDILVQSTRTSTNSIIII